MNHDLIPKHEKLTEDEKTELNDKFNITFIDLPRIKLKDAAIKDLDVQEGDVIKITRPSQTAGTSVFYRGVAND